jgi:tetratricopeptide (TPR) repeat protein
MSHPLSFVSESTDGTKRVLRRNLMISLDAKNPILHALAAGHFTVGLELFQTLETPSPEDCMWAGNCFLILGQTLEGLERLLDARNRGLEDALGLIVYAYRQGGEIERAQRVLAGAQTEKLHPYGQASILREQGLLDLHEGRLKPAIKSLEQAFEIALTDPITACFRGNIAASTADVLSRLGRDARVLTVVAHALPTSSAPQRARLLFMRAFSHLNTGQLREAERDLEDARSSDVSAVLPPMERYSHGVLRRFQGHDHDAVQCFLESAALARSQDQPEIEFYAEVALSRLSTSNDEVMSARAHLARAGGLAEGVQMHAELALAHGALLTRTADPQAISVLEQAAQGFERLENERDLALTHLHLAEAFLRVEQPDQARKHLVQVADARHALGSGGAFAAELRSLPSVFEMLASQSVHSHSYAQVLLEDWRQLETEPAQVSITSLGGIGLSMDGIPVRLESGLLRTVEVLTFLLDRGEQGIERIQSDVFEDESPEHSRAYIHNIKRSIKKSLPRLAIQFDKVRRKYAVQATGIRLHWDVAAVRDALRSDDESGLRRALGLYTGPFLPNTDTHWAIDVRLELESALARVGLRVLIELEHARRYEECIGLAERLLEVHPLDVSVAVVLVRCTLKIFGVLEAQQALDRIKSKFMSLIGDVPEELLTTSYQTPAQIN